MVVDLNLHNLCSELDKNAIKMLTCSTYPFPSIPNKVQLTSPPCFDILILSQFEENGKKLWTSEHCNLIECQQHIFLRHLLCNKYFFKHCFEILLNHLTVFLFFVRSSYFKGLLKHSFIILRNFFNKNYIKETSFLISKTKIFIFKY